MAYFAGFLVEFNHGVLVKNLSVITRLHRYNDYNVVDAKISGRLQDFN